MGMILVSGATVMGNPFGEGYLNHKVYEAGANGKYAFDPYVEYNDKIWYNTEDMGRYDNPGAPIPDGQTYPSLQITGRVKRFVKRGGEMVSLGAIEHALAPAFPERNQKLSYAVESISITAPDGSSEPFMGLLLQRDVVATEKEGLGAVRQALSQVYSKSALNLHMPDAVFLVDTIPVLGTGKLGLSCFVYRHSIFDVFEVFDFISLESISFAI